MLLGTRSPLDNMVSRVSAASVSWSINSCFSVFGNRVKNKG